jgi:hypothetical protein
MLNKLFRLADQPAWTAYDCNLLRSFHIKPPCSTTRGNSPSSPLCRADNGRHRGWVPRALCRTPDSELLKSLIGVRDTLISPAALSVPAHCSARSQCQRSAAVLSPPPPDAVTSFEAASDFRWCRFPSKRAVPAQPGRSDPHFGVFETIQ